MPRRSIAIVIAGLMLLVAAACGQKPGVSTDMPPLGAGTGLPPGFEVNEKGEVVDDTGQVVGNADQLLGGQAGTQGTAGTDATTSTVGDGGSGSDGDGGGGGSPNQPDSAVGVSGTTIKIGIHAPLTGAAPVPSDSVDKGKDLYFRWMCGEKNQRVFGRCIEVVLKNDNYNPSQAVAVCKEMVEKDKVFMLSGAAGTDQIQACARYANSVGVPYLGAGVTEVGLTGLPYFFATTMTYPDQAPLLADYMVEELGAKGEKNAMLWFNTPNFQDAHDAFVKAMRDRGISLAYDKAVSKYSGRGEASSEVQAMKLRQIDNVFILTSPVWFLQVLQESNQQSFEPTWTGVGITMTFDTVASVGCRGGDSLDGATFFSPFPAWIDRNKFDPDFERAVSKFYPEENNGQGDDFMLLSWSGTKLLWEIFERVGREVTRNKFVNVLQNARNIRTGVGPPVSFTPNDHFGSDQVHVSRASCSDNRWHTIQSFVNDW